MTARASPWTVERLLPIELCIYAAATVACLTACIAEVPSILAKARAVQAFFDLRPAQSDWAEYMAMTGDLPAVADATIGLRPAMPAGERTGNLLWRCGTRPPPAGWALPSAPTPAASAAVDFSVCRKGRDE